MLSFSDLLGSSDHEKQLKLFYLNLIYLEEIIKAGILFVYEDGLS